MDHSLVTFPFSTGFLLLAALLAGGLSYWLYHKDTTLATWLRKTLTGIRFVVLFVLFALLLEPSIKTFKNNYEPEEIAIIIDDSKSMMADSINTKSLISDLNQLVNTYKENDFVVNLLSIDGSRIEALDSLVFQKEHTDLSKGLNQVKRNYEGRNLNEVLLISDGIHNLGVSPLYSSYPFVINTLALGDTTIKKDLSITSLAYNKQVGLGNDFFIDVNIKTVGFSNQKIQLNVLLKDSLIRTEELIVRSDQSVEKVHLKLNAKTEGFSVFKLNVVPLKGETNVLNNTKSAFVKVVKKKEKIIFLAAAPHPDIKAFSSVLKGLEQYDVEVYFPFSQKKPDVKAAALVICHGLPNSTNVFLKELMQLKKSKNAILYMWSQQVDFVKLQQQIGFIKVKGPWRQFDQAHAALNTGFSLFKSDEFRFNLFRDAPPLVVPFNEITVSTSSSVLLKQKIGSVSTDKPLWVIDGRQSVLLGEGFWKWEIFEAYLEGEKSNLDQAIKKVCQLLISKNKNVQFKVSAGKDEFEAQGAPYFFIQAYNDLNEEISDLSIDLRIAKGDSLVVKTELITVNGKEKYWIPKLTEGLYNYRAETVLGGSKKSSSGQFVVTKSNLEALNTRADFSLLKDLAVNHKGQFFTVKQLSKLLESSKKQQSTRKIHTVESQDLLLIYKVIALLLISFLTLEWFIRKRIGGNT